MGTIVEHVNDGLANSGEPLDGLLNGSGAGGAGHADDGEHRLGLGDLGHGGLLRRHALGIRGHGWIVRPRR